LIGRVKHLRGEDHALRCRISGKRPKTRAATWNRKGSAGAGRAREEKISRCPALNGAGQW